MRFYYQRLGFDSIDKYVIEKKEDIGDELADVLNYLLIMCHDLDIDIIDALDKKISKNESKYPVETAKGNHTKYDRL